MIEIFTSEQNCLKLKRLVHGLTPLVAVLQARNIDIQPLFQLADISPAHLSAPNAFMSLDQELRFTQAAIDTANEPLLGLLVGRSFHVSLYGTLGLAMFCGPTLRDGLQTCAEYISLSWSRFLWRQNVEGKLGILEIQDLMPLGSCHDYLLDRDLSAVLILCKELLGTEFEVKTIQLKRNAPQHWQRYREILGCNIEFEADRTAVLFESSLLDRPLPSANPAMAEVTRSQCAAMVERLARENSYADMVENLLFDEFGQFLTLEAIAEKLHVSTRTLRRKLQQEDTSFQAISNRLRCNIACQLLADDVMSIAQIAEHLGYSDSATFCHAFKRWSGSSPKNYLNLL